MPREAVQFCLTDVHGLPIDRARVFGIGEDGKRYRAKRSSVTGTYYIPTEDFNGTLYLKHLRYQNEVYSIKDLESRWPNKSWFYLSLGKKRHGFSTYSGIRYPYIRQPNRIALMLHDTVLNNAEVYRQEAIKHLLNLGAEYGKVKEEYIKGHFRKKIFIGDFLATIIYLPKSINIKTRVAISDYLFSIDDRVLSGLLLGTSNFLQRELEVRLLDPEDRAKALLIFKKEELSLVSEKPPFGNPIPGYFRVRVPTLETEQIIEVIDRLNEMDLFYPIG